MLCVDNDAEIEEFEISLAKGTRDPFVLTL
jgi:hypothetical protein